ncbi:MAG: NADH-ubiquinone oxidoreductase-F iron-sulfur binding region domain-containing protein [Nitrospirota bacterium]
MSKNEDKILLKHEVKNIDDYLTVGGFKALKKAISMPPDAIIQEVKKSGLRGRGGAGFPTGTKWDSLYKYPSKKKYLCCNAAEGEPGTFKDRYIIKKNPYQVIEGMAIGAYAIGAARSYMGIKVIFEEEIRRVADALKECEERGFIGKNVFGGALDIPIEIKLGPDNYLFGEETAFMRVLEGGPCMPRIKPSFILGLGNGLKMEREDNAYVDGIPTLVNNLETYANIPHIINNGAEWFKSFGTEKSPGTMVFTLNGDVKRPGMYELPLGTNLSRLIYEIGGGPANGSVKGVLPGGPSNKILAANELDVALDYDSLKAAGSGLGSGCVIVYDETACMVKVALTFSIFFMKGSCGQCTMCNSGTKRLTDLLTFIEHGRGDEKDITEIWSWIPQMMKKEAGRCYLITAEPVVVSSIMQKFPEHFIRHIEEGRCPYSRELTSFKILSFNEETSEFSQAML